MTHSNDTSPIDVAVVGGGASGVCVAAALARRHGIATTIIEPAPDLGVGLAYGTPCLRHLLNVNNAGMSAIAEDPAHFTNWLRATVDPATRPDGFAPRQTYGRYLHALATQAAPDHRRAHAVSCVTGPNGSTLALSDGHRIAARHVVLAPGNFDPAPVVDVPKECERTYHHNAWDDALYTTIEPQAPVLLIGTGLTAVDVVLRLRDAGHRGVITAVSRHGWWPARHDGGPKTEAPVIEEGAGPLAAFRVFRASAAAGAAPCAVVAALRERTNDLWLSWDETARRRFRRHLQRRWDILRHRMAPAVADAIEADRAAGTLVTRQGHVTGLAPDDGAVVVSAKTPRGTAQYRAAHVVNCTGPSLNYARAASPLLHALLGDGTITPGPLGSGLNVTPDGFLIARDGTPSAILSTLGPPRLGVLFESIAMPEIHRQAAALADRIAQALRKIP